MGLELVPEMSIMGFLPKQAFAISLGVGISTEEAVCTDPNYWVLFPSLTH